MLASRSRIVPGTLAVLFLSQSLLALVPTAQTLDYLNDPANPGLRGLIAGERLAALYGGVLAENPCPGAGCQTTDTFVQGFLDVLCAEDALGVNDVSLGDGTTQGQKLGSIGIRNDKFEAYTYLQMYECPAESPNPGWIPYHDTVVQVLVVLGDPTAHPFVSQRIGCLGNPGNSACVGVQ